MKNLAITLTLAFCGLTAAVAENPNPSAPAGQRDGKMREKMKERFMENLPSEARERFKEAREKALQDPEIKKLKDSVDRTNREFFQAMRTKMLEIDPGLAELVRNHEKRSERPEGRGKPDGQGKLEGRGKPDGQAKPDGQKKKDGPKKKDDRLDSGRGIGNLSDEEREKLMTARTKAQSDPAVEGASKLKSEAKTPEERKTASEEYRKAMHTAMLKADPALGPILEKLGPQPAGSKPSAGGSDEMMRGD